MPKIAGKATIKRDGNAIPTEDGAKLNPGGANRRPERHGDKTYYKQEGQEPRLECTVLATADQDVTALAAIDDATIEFESDAGHTYVLRHAFVVDVPELDTGNGRIPLVFSADSCDKL